MEGAEQSKGNDGDGTHQPKQDGDAGGGFERHAVDPGKRNNASYLYSTTQPRNLHQATQGYESHQYKCIYRAEGARGRKTSKEREAAGHNHHPFQQRVT